MFAMFRKLFSRKRECPECGFQGSPRDFKRVKADLLDEKTKEKLNNASLGIGSSSGDSGTSGTSGEKPKVNLTKAKSKRPNKKKATTTSGTSGSSASSTSGSSGVN